MGTSAKDGDEQFKILNFGYQFHETNAKEQCRYCISRDE
jgi:hypothetical protein